MSWLPKKNIVVPTDLSTASLEAVDTALAMVEKPEHLHVLFVLPTIHISEPGVVWDAVDDDKRTQHAEAALRVKFSDPKYQGMEIVAIVGDPGHEIADFAQARGADLIVLPSHGRTGIKRLLIGSVAERVVRLAHCPVLVLKH